MDSEVCTALGKLISILAFAAGLMGWHLEFFGCRRLAHHPHNAHQRYKNYGFKQENIVKGEQSGLPLKFQIDLSVSFGPDHFESIPIMLAVEIRSQRELVEWSTLYPHS